MANKLEKVKEILENYGWRKDYMGNYLEGFCLVGAMDYLVSKEYEEIEDSDNVNESRFFTDKKNSLVKETISRIKKYDPDFPLDHPDLELEEDIFEWNDRDYRTKEEVMAILEKEDVI